MQFRSTFEVAKNANGMIAILNRLASEGVKVAVFPECALTGYEQGPVMKPSAEEVDAAEQRIRHTCSARGIAAVFGSIYKVNGHAYDTAVVFDSHGELVER
ncbi:MAG: nitrilase-related carbon-nitrogen hydrolase, partial [Bryobacteraceae bacterium]